MIRLRHRRGGGSLLGNDAEAVDSSVDRKSSVSGDANLFYANVRGSVIVDSIVAHAHIEDSQITNCQIVMNPQPHAQGLIRGSVLNNVRIWDNPELIEVALSGPCVFGRTRIVGPWNLAAPIRIHAGEWRQPPRYHIIEGGEIRVGISECVNGRFHLGCWCKTYEDWVRPGYRQLLGKAAGWTLQMIDETYDYFTQWNLPAH